MDTTWDIFFFCDQDVNIQDFLSYFQEMPNFKIQNKKADYFNKDTQTSFIFELHEKYESDGLIPVSMTLDLLLMNSGNAHEAAMFTGRLCEKFKLKIFYPYTMSTQGEDFSLKRFIERWDRNKAKIIKVFSSHQPYTLRSNQIVQDWNWNYNIPWTNKFFDGKFDIPSIKHGSFDGEIASFIDFTPQQSTALPRVDYYLVTKNRTNRVFQGSHNLDRYIIHIDSLEDAFCLMRFMPFENAPFHKYKPEKDQLLINNALRKSICKKLTVINTQSIVDHELLRDENPSYEESIY